MTKGARNFTDDPQRLALEKLLLDLGLTQGEAAERCGIKQPDFSRTIKKTSRDFRAYRHRLRIQFGLGCYIWIPAEEVEEIRALSHRLNLDLATAYLQRIFKAAGAAKLLPPSKRHGGTAGFRLFRDLIKAAFPKSPTLKRPYYANLD